MDSLLTNSIYLFAGNSDGSPTEVSSTLKVFSFQLYENETLALDFVPCYRISDGVIGMYDLVSQAFCTNADTSTTFTKGADV